MRGFELSCAGASRAMDASNVPVNNPEWAAWMRGVRTPRPHHQNVRNACVCRDDRDHS